MRLSNAWKVRFLAFFGFVLLAVFVSGYWYFCVYTKSPEYATQKIKESIFEHDLGTFRKYVNLDGVLNKSADEFMDAMLEAEGKVTPEAKMAVTGFKKFFKAPLIASFRTLFLDYVETGKWENLSEENMMTIDTASILDKAGFKNVSFKEIEYVTKNEKEETAEVGAVFFFEDVSVPYTVKLMFEKQQEGHYCLQEIVNLSEVAGFVAEKKGKQQKEYIAATKDIFLNHENTIKIARLEEREILSKGNLAKDETRMRLKKHEDEVVLVAWKNLKAELEKMNVPLSARYLHNLRLRICDMYIEYIELYSTWLVDKELKTARLANERLREAQSLEKEMLVLLRQHK